MHERLEQSEVEIDVLIRNNLFQRNKCDFSNPCNQRDKINFLECLQIVRDKGKTSKNKAEIEI
jgi:hypothetical protein